MIVHHYTTDDFEQIKELHARSGFDYPLPSLSGEEFFSRRVIRDDGLVAMGAFLKLTAEAYLICHPRWRNPAWRFEALRQLSHQCNNDAKDAGVKEVVAFLPPGKVRDFGRRLNRLGWEKIRNDWQCVYHPVE